MAKSAYRSMEHFTREELVGRVGPMASPWDEMADEIYRPDVNVEFDGLWDASEVDDE